MILLKLLPRLFLVLQLLSTTSGLDSPNWLVEEKRERYADYEKCMNNRAEELDRSQNSERYTGTIAIRGSTAILPCFLCLDPTDEEYLEDIWKPNESFLGRKMQKFLDKVKEAVRTGKYKVDVGNKSQDTGDEIQPYCWEYRSPKSMTWTSVMNMSMLTEPYEKAKMIMKSFLPSNMQQYAIGDHFELIIKYANLTDTGWYRCFRCSDSSDVSRAYYIDIVPEYPIQLRKYSRLIDLRSEFRSSVKEFNIEIFGKATPWTSCNKCGEDEIGESNRQISCYIRPMRKFARSSFASQQFKALQLFGAIPCRSSLVPDSIRPYLKRYTVYEEYRECKAKCPLSRNQTRIIEGKDGTGNPVTLEEFLPGEFAITERLPLLKSIHRKVLRQIVNDLLILDCGIRNEGVLWKKDGIHLNSSSLLNEYPDGRIVISSDGQLIIAKLELRDDGRYSCSTFHKGIIASFRVFVTKNEKDVKRTVQYIQMGIRLFAFCLLICLIGSVMFSA
ncbi:hypothetical protein DdX_03356 [Ditylenchus destructor]|uniref:Ig-like domain-containing protein n=1 Tax=Ditylenchus destructor TaxID=166010 RepID=A0AAD4RCY5_9BILA|nr:hypothetical protein DdX_03356 [Ditylenchus destructor]